MKKQISNEINSNIIWLAILALLLAIIAIGINIDSAKRASAFASLKTAAAECVETSEDTQFVPEWDVELNCEGSGSTDDDGDEYLADRGEQCYKICDIMKNPSFVDKRSGVSPCTEGCKRVYLCEQLREKIGKATPQLIKRTQINCTKQKLELYQPVNYEIESSTTMCDIDCGK